MRHEVAKWLLFIWKENALQILQRSCREAFVIDVMNPHKNYLLSPSKSTLLIIIM
jgi:hypothetical protein